MSVVFPIGRGIRFWLLGGLICVSAGVASDTATSAASSVEPSLQADTVLVEETHQIVDAQVQPSGPFDFPGSDQGLPLNGSSGESWSREYLLAPAKITSQYEWAYGFQGNSGTRNNRSSLRIEYSKFFLEYFYLRLDAKVMAFLPHDHRSRLSSTWLNDEPFEENISFGALARESYLQVSKGAMSIRMGLQAPTCGELDFVSVTDELSPQDFREPLVIAQEDLRLGQPMLILDQYSTWGDVNIFLVPYPLLNQHPRKGTEYFFDPFGGQPISEWERDPWKMEYALRWKKNVNKTDISLLAAKLLSNEPYYYKAESSLGKDVQPYTMLGATVSHALGTSNTDAFKKLLLKAEYAAKMSKAFMDENINKVERNVLDAAFGMSYSWDPWTSFTIEAMNSRILDWSSRLQGVPRNSYSIVGMLNRQFFNDHLSVTLITMYSGPYVSYFHTLSASYLWDDWFTISGEVLLPTPEDKRSYLWHLREQKQFAARITHAF